MAGTGSRQRKPWADGFTGIPGTSSSCGRVRAVP